MAKCVFCKGDVAKGSGLMFVKNDGTVYTYCSAKCEKNARMRDPRFVKWTEAFRAEKEAKKQ